MPWATVGHLTYDPDALAAVCQRFGVQELALFGSVLRADFDPTRSDVDVLVTFLPDSPVVSLLDVLHVQQALEDLFHRPVDLTEARGLKPGMAPHVLRERRVIYVAPRRSALSH